MSQPHEPVQGPRPFELFQLYLEAIRIIEIELVADRDINFTLF